MERPTGEKNKKSALLKISFNEAGFFMCIYLIEKMENGTVVAMVATSSLHKSLAEVTGLITEFTTLSLAEVTGPITKITTTMAEVIRSIKKVAIIPVKTCYTNIEIHSSNESIIPLYKINAKIIIHHPFPTFFKAFTPPQTIKT